MRQLGILVGLVVLATGLSGCIMSDAPLFADHEFATPFAPGPLVAQQYAHGAWSKGKPGVLTVAGARYAWTPAGEDEQTFTVVALRNGFFAAVRRREPTPENGLEFYYDLLRQDGPVILRYEADCKRMLHVRVAPAGRPARVEKKDSELHCIYATRDALVRALLAFSRQHSPTYRYVPEPRRAD